MSKNIIIALAVAALPVFAQDAAPQPPCAPKPCAPHHCQGKNGMPKPLLEKFDANKDGQLDEQEKAAMKADFEARHAEMKQKMLEKFDANKDGQLDEQEKAAMKADFEARHGKPCGKGPRGHHHGHGPHGCKG